MARAFLILLLAACAGELPNGAAAGADLMMAADLTASADLGGDLADTAGDLAATTGDLGASDLGVAVDLRQTDLASSGVPVFLAMGYGTRRVLSCDYGLTWPLDEADVANGGDDGTLVRGLAGGHGTFVAAVGGGGTRNLFISHDGVTWDRRVLGGNGYSDVAFGNGRFVAGGGHISIVSTDDGASFGMEGTMGSGGILRHLAFGDYQGGRFAAAGDTGRRMNSSDAVTWGHEVSGGNGFNALAYGAGRFVALHGDGSYLYSTDGGDNWQDGSIAGAANARGILWDGARFLVTTSGNAFTSPDGATWTPHTASGGPDVFDVSDDHQHYAGSANGDLFHSTDGITWTRTKQGGQGIVRIKFGRVSASAVCP
jgi:hypothetical protein